MQYPQRYELCCVISLYLSETILFTSCGLQDVSSSDPIIQNSTSYETRLDYNEGSGQVKGIKKSDQATQDGFIVEDIVQSLYHLFQLRKNQDPSEYRDELTFRAISKYFRSCLDHVCASEGIQMKRLYLVFVLPENWVLERGIIDLVIMPLLTEAGVVFTEKDISNISFTTYLEAIFVRDDIWNITRDASECKSYVLHLRNNAFNLHSRTFRPSSMANFEILQNYKGVLENCIDLEGLQKQIIKYTLKLGYLLDTPLKGQHYYNYKTAADRLTHNILKNVRNYLKRNKRFVGIYNSHFLRKYLDESQSQQLYSSSFMKLILRKVTTQLSNIIQFILPLTHNSSILFLENPELKDNWFYVEIYKILLLLLPTEEIPHHETKSRFFMIHKFLKKDIASYASLLAARKLMLAAPIILSPPPVIVEKTEELDKVGLPIYSPDVRAARKSSKPEVIVFIDISQYYTSVYFDEADTDFYVHELHVSPDEHKSQQSFLPFGPFNHSFMNEALSRHPNISDSQETKAKPAIFTRKIRHDRTSMKIPLERENLIEHLQEIMDDTRAVIGKFKEIGIAFSFEKPIMDTLQIKTRTDLEKFIKENNATKFEGVDSRNIIIIDQGKRRVWEMIQLCQLAPPSFYVHSHISEDYIYVKLHQLVDTTEPESKVKNSNSIIIKDRMLEIDNVYKQASETLWTYIHSLDNKEKKKYIQTADIASIDTIDYFNIFKNSLIHFMKEKLFRDSSDDIGSYLETSTFTISLIKTDTMTITLYELMHLAINPVLEKLANNIVSCLSDNHIFGRFIVDRLFVTGGVMKIWKYNHWYHQSIMTRLKSYINHLIPAKKKYVNFLSHLTPLSKRTKLNISIDTCQQDQPTTKNIALSDRKSRPFCLNAFLKGDLRLVSSTTYLVDIDQNELGVENSHERDSKYVILARGDILSEKRMKLDILDNDNGSKNSQLRLYKYHEPHDLQNPNDEIFSFKYVFMNNIKPSSLTTICINPLYDAHCIEIICENTRVIEGKLELYTTKSIIGERQTLKYF